MPKICWKNFDSLHETLNVRTKFAKEPKHDLAHQLLVCSQNLWIRRLNEIKNTHMFVWCLYVQIVRGSLNLFECNPPMAIWAFFQITIPYVDIFDHQRTDVEQNRFKSGFSNVSDQNSPLCLVVLCMDTTQWKKSHDLRRLGKNKLISKLQSIFSDGSIKSECY